MNTDMRLDPTPWKNALESQDADSIYTGFSHIVGAVADKLHNTDPAVLKTIDDLYHATKAASPSKGSSPVTSTTVQAAVEMLKGLHLAVHGYFDYDKQTPPAQVSYDREFSQIHNKFSHGEAKTAEEMFKKISSLILHGQVQIDSYADLGLKPATIHQEVRNWASALGMLARA